MKNNPTVRCPLCNDQVDKLVYRYHFDSEQTVIDKIKEDHPSWSEKDGLCTRCQDYYQTEIVMGERIIPSIGPHFPVKSVDDFIILPTALRLDADPRFTGKGVTICFIDSGFCRHPDLMVSSNRIKAMIDITRDNEPILEDDTSESAWHGTMTSVVCAGDGYLSRGLYKGIANEANLVLLKVQDDSGKITTQNIIKALDWVLLNHEYYQIRILNISLAADEAESYKESRVDLLTEELIDAGIIVVAAAGNSESGRILPPANAPRVITVGGVDDNNQLNGEHTSVWHSSYSKAEDELMKPELLAPAIWLAAPILPNSEQQVEAMDWFEKLTAHNSTPTHVVDHESTGIANRRDLLNKKDVTFESEKYIRQIQSAKYISGHYMHVDGTSFAAPITCSVIAQLLQINPDLKPNDIRQILFSTARRIPGWAPERQGFGVVQPRKALLKVLQKECLEIPANSPNLDHERGLIEFNIYEDHAGQISLAGTFNNWEKEMLFLRPVKNGIWKIEIPMLPEGKWLYKFFTDENQPLEDFGNPFREPDGYDGFNSILVIPSKN